MMKKSQQLVLFILISLGALSSVFSADRKSETTADRLNTNVPEATAVRAVDANGNPIPAAGQVQQDPSNNPSANPLNYYNPTVAPQLPAAATAPVPSASSVPTATSTSPGISSVLPALVQALGGSKAATDKSKATTPTTTTNPITTNSGNTNSGGSGSGLGGTANDTPYDDGGVTPAGVSELDMNIARNSSCYGKAPGVGKYQCYKGVKTLIAAGLGKDENCVRGILATGPKAGGYASDAVVGLPKLGYKKVYDGEDSSNSECKKPGTVLVYYGYLHMPGASEAKRKLASKAPRGGTGGIGDYAGHIEVYGTSGQYHSSFASSTPRDKGSGRRILAGCYRIPKEALEDKSSALAKCKSGGRQCTKSGSGSGSGAGQKSRTKQRTK